jgi:hypothetical protein
LEAKIKEAMDDGCDNEERARSEKWMMDGFIGSDVLSGDA